MRTPEADWPALSEKAVYAGLDDPFISPLSAQPGEAINALARRVDPDGKLMAWFRANREWCLADPMRMVVVMRGFLQTGRLP